MQLLFAAVIAMLAVLAQAEGNWEIDWSKVVPRTEIPGFWDNRSIKHLPTGLNRNRRIVGGEIVAPHAHPYQAGLLMQYAAGTGICGGSVISTRTIFTAAHCPENANNVQVILGAHQLTSNEPNQQRQTVLPENFRIHAQYNSATLANDVAILILPIAATFNAFVQPVILPTNLVSELFVGELATISGWGRFSDTIPGSSAYLRAVSNNVITNQLCQASFGDNIIASTLCIQTTGGRSACSGDSGGPLTINRNGQIIQIGVASFVDPSGCELGFPGGFARVTSFLDWVNQHRVD